MPTAIELDLVHPSWMDAPPAKLHGLACAVFESDRAAHDGPEKPFTIWPLRRDPAAAPGRSTLRLTWLPDDAPPKEPETVGFGSAVCRVLVSRTRKVSFAQLAGTRPTRRATFTFHTPTVFARHGVKYPVMDPDLVLNSLARRWSAHSMIAVPDDLLTELRSELTVRGWAGRTEDLDTGKPGRITGFVGELELSLRGGSDRVQALFGALAASAEFLGVGAMRTYGMGVVTARSE